MQAQPTFWDHPIICFHTSIPGDCEALEQDAQKRAACEVQYLVDMAKAEALDYLGESRAAIGVVERHP